MAVAMFDTGMRYLAASARWRADYGLEAMPLDGRRYDDVWPGGPAHWRQVHEACLAGTDADCDEERLVRADGAEQWIRWAVSAWRTESGAIGGLIIASEDITARKQATNALRASRERLEQRTTQLSRLASELVLTEQRARAQLAKTLHDHLQQLLFSSRLKLGRAAARLADRAPTESDLLSRASQELDEAISAARSLAVELSPPGLHEAGLPSAVGWLAGWVRDKYGLTMEVTIDADANPERRDIRTLVFESLRELVFNVVKHARVDHVTVALTGKPPDTIELTVEDRGVGFDPSAVWHPANPGESGLGLFSIRERLALLGGRLDVTSTPGKGARFVLAVPRGSGWPLDPAPAREPALDGPGPAGPPPLTVLIADDHALVREGLRDLLGDRRELLIVGEATNGREAVELARALQPDVVVMDVSMPELDGVEATRRILSEQPAVQVFGLSTYERADQLHAIERAGAAGFFSKAEDTSRLLQRLLQVHAAKGRTG